MERNTLLLIIVGIVIGGIVAPLLLRPPEGSRPKLLVEDADDVSELSWGRIPIEPRTIPRPLIEYPNAVSPRPLVKAPLELEEKAGAVLARPLIEYSNSAFSFILEGLPNPPAALPRPVVEYANSGSVFALQPLTGVDFSQVMPRPLVEGANAGWIMSLNPPGGLLEMNK